MADAMVKAIVELGEREDRVLTIVKGKYGLKNKSDAMNFVIDSFEQEMLEPELRPEFVKGFLARRKRAVLHNYRSVEDMAADLEK